jgi:hypothetical protein
MRECFLVVNNQTSKMESQFTIPSSLALAHTFNSRGELGMFVNPYNCSCSTCRNYVAGEEPPSDTAPAAAATVPTTTVSVTAEERSVLVKALQSRIDELVRQQDTLTDEGARSHDEMAAVDQEFDELDREIQKLEGLLERFH